MTSISWPAVVAPKKPLWLKTTALLAAASLILFVALAWWRPWQPGRWAGLGFGTVAAALFVNAALYPARRRLRTWPLGTAQRWLQLHIYGSVLATLFVVIHIGFRLPAGQMGYGLLGLTVWTTATGLLGVVLQKRLPVIMARSLKVEAIYERIPELVAALVAEADGLMAGASDVLSRVYQSEIRPALAVVRPHWGYLVDAASVRARAHDPLVKVQPFLDRTDHERAKDLEAIVADKLDLDAHASYQRALRLWLVTHIPAAMLLIGLIVVHVFAVLYF